MFEIIILSEIVCVRTLSQGDFDVGFADCGVVTFYEALASQLTST
jgi:hypothetical protein